jgi:hypothetical protein
MLLGGIAERGQNPAVAHREHVFEMLKLTVVGCRIRTLGSMMRGVRVIYPTVDVAPLLYETNFLEMVMMRQNGGRQHHQCCQPQVEYIRFASHLPAKLQKICCNPVANTNSHPKFRSRKTLR